MQHNVDMIKKNGAKWGKNVRIIGLSIDREKSKLKSHVQTKGWDNVEHYFRAQSKCSEVYGVSGVPRVMLVDQSGTIVFSGHPASRKLEEDLDNLSQGKTLEGDNVFKGGEVKKEESTV